MTDMDSPVPLADCLAEAAQVLAAGLAETDELAASRGVAEAARAAGCVTDRQIAEWSARYFPGLPVAIQEEAS